MGNAAIGHTMNSCGCTDALGFENSAKALINMNGIEPWNARDLVRDNLRRQGDLAKRSPLRNVHVEDGLNYIGTKIGGWFATKLTREQFTQTAMDLLVSKGIRCQPSDRDELYQIFDSMDFDRSGNLSVGEWAGGLSVFFRGSQEDSVHAVFNTLDRDKSRTLTKSELQEYLKPFVKAMSPPQADALRPILLKKATDDIYREMDLDHRNDISSEELLAWTRRGNNIIDKLADIIDKEVYRIWLQERERQRYAQSYANGPNNMGYPAKAGYSSYHQSPSHYGSTSNLQKNNSISNLQTYGPQGSGSDQRYGSPNDRYNDRYSDRGYGDSRGYGSPSQSYDDRAYSDRQRHNDSRRGDYGDYGLDPYPRDGGYGLDRRDDHGGYGRDRSRGGDVYDARDGRYVPPPPPPPYKGDGGRGFHDSGGGYGGYGPPASSTSYGGDRGRGRY